MGFTRGKSTPVVLYGQSDDTVLVVYGDDVTFLGYPEALGEILEQMRAWWDIKLRGIMGDEVGDDREMTILNRKLKWHGSARILSADEEHVR